jgi:F-type H+-transporting ATPase subunit b
MNHVELSDQLPQMSALAMIDVDATSLISAAIFVVMLVLLNQLLFQPYLKLTRERSRLTTGAQASAEETFAEADAVLADYKQRLASARSEAATLRESLRRSGQEEESRIVTTARDRAAAALAAKREALTAQVAEAERQVDERAAALSSAIVQKVLS